MQAIFFRLQTIPGRLQAIFPRLQTIPGRMKVTSGRLQTTFGRVKASRFGKNAGPAGMKAGRLALPAPCERLRPPQCLCVSVVNTNER